ncbi:MAG: hypothetical protein WC897_04785 [Candidatus Gracilibacteria bacterium]
MAEENLTRKINDEQARIEQKVLEEENDDGTYVFDDPERYIKTFVEDVNSFQDSLSDIDDPQIKDALSRGVLELLDTTIPDKTAKDTLKADLDVAKAELTLALRKYYKSIHKLQEWQAFRYEVKEGDNLLNIVEVHTGIIWKEDPQKYFAIVKALQEQREQEGSIPLIDETGDLSFNTTTNPPATLELGEYLDMESALLKAQPSIKAIIWYGLVSPEMEKTMEKVVIIEKAKERGDVTPESDVEKQEFRAGAELTTDDAKKLGIVSDSGTLEEMGWAWGDLGHDAVFKLPKGQKGLAILPDGIVVSILDAKGLGIVAPDENLRFRVEIDGWKLAIDDSGEEIIVKDSKIKRPVRAQAVDNVQTVVESGPSPVGAWAGSVVARFKNKKPDLKAHPEGPFYLGTVIIGDAPAEEKALRFAENWGLDDEIIVDSNLKSIEPNDLVNILNRKWFGKGKLASSAGSIGSREFGDKDTFDYDQSRDPGFARLHEGDGAELLESLSMEDKMRFISEVAEDAKLNEQQILRIRQLEMITGYAQSLSDDLGDAQTWSLKIHDWFSSGPEETKYAIDEWLANSVGRISGRIISDPNASLESLLAQDSGNAKVLLKALESNKIRIDDVTSEEDLIRQKSQVVESLRMLGHYDDAEGVVTDVLRSEFDEGKERFVQDKDTGKLKKNEFGEDNYAEFERRATIEVGSAVSFSNAEAEWAEKGMSPEQINLYIQDLVGLERDRMVDRYVAENYVGDDTLRGAKSGIWQQYKDMRGMGAFDISDEHWKTIIHELVINAPFIVLSGGFASLGRMVVSVPLRTLVASGRLAKFGLVAARAGKTGEAIGATGRAVVDASELARLTDGMTALQKTAFYGRNLEVVGMAGSKMGGVLAEVGGGGAGLLTEGFLFELAHAGLQGESLFNQPQWVQNVLWSSVTLGLFHGAGKVGERLSGGALATLKNYAPKIADKKVATLVTNLISKGFVEVAAMMFISGVQKGVLVLQGEEVDYNLVDELFHALITVGALKVSGGMVQKGIGSIPKISGKMAEVEADSTVNRVKQDIRVEREEAPIRESADKLVSHLKPGDELIISRGEGKSPMRLRIIEVRSDRSLLANELSGKNPKAQVKFDLIEDNGKVGLKKSNSATVHFGDGFERKRGESVDQLVLDEERASLLLDEADKESLKGPGVMDKKSREIYYKMIGKCAKGLKLQVYTFNGQSEVILLTGEKNLSTFLGTFFEGFLEDGRKVWVTFEYSGNGSIAVRSEGVGLSFREDFKVLNNEPLARSLAYVDNITSYQFGHYMGASKEQAGSFEPKSELERIKAMKPGRGRELAKKEWKVKFEAQQREIAKIPQRVRDYLETFPDSTIQEVFDYALGGPEAELRFSRDQRVKTKNIILAYMKKCEVVSRAFDEYQGREKELVAKVFGVDISKLEGDIQMSLHGSVIFFNCRNPEVYKLLYGREEALRSGGFFNKKLSIDDVSGTVIVGNNVRESSVGVVAIHELRHSENLLLRPEDSATNVGWSSPSVRAADEVLAYMADGSDKTSILDVLTEKDGLYDYYSDRRKEAVASKDKGKISALEFGWTEHCKLVKKLVDIAFGLGSADLDLLAITPVIYWDTLVTRDGHGVKTVDRAKFKVVLSEVFDGAINELKASLDFLKKQYSTGLLLGKEYASGLKTYMQNLRNKITELSNILDKISDFDLAGSLSVKTDELEQLYRDLGQELLRL